ncbi:DUF4377 domain-containing protein [Moraxella oblonga]|uniref:DUF4377 domain-containing protein n=1 Tax=Moraxella oblonga TaxID=200413 RepID=UPI00082B932E|nr:DUF4377 domain-containing protein [Moraxella oblonga]
MKLRFTFLLSLMCLTACQSTPPVPEPRYIPNIKLTDSVILNILPHRVPCQSTTPMQCLLVKPNDNPDARIFSIAYNDIQGFEPRIGTSYTIKARQEIDQNNGKPTGQWRLEEILNQNIVNH